MEYLRPVGTGLGAVIALSLAAPTSLAQTTYSIEYRNPTIALIDCTGIAAITEADILRPNTTSGLPGTGPVSPPCIVFTGGATGLGLALYAGCVGHPPGVPCGVEVDALSYGLDGPALPGGPPGFWKFSVDRFAVGIPGGPFVPDLFSEAPFAESAADVFLDPGLPPAPLPPFASPPFNVLAFDGDGLKGPSPFGYPGLGLVEPTAPGCPPTDPGDNVDALDYDGPNGFPIYFSLDGAFFDPRCPGIAGTNSAGAHGVQPGDILVATAPGVWGVYATAAQLGLDLVGPGTDDIDAIAIFENGTPGYQRSPGPYPGWGQGQPFDMVLFSVRRGSAVTLVPFFDAFLGVPIEEGDILQASPAAGSPPGMFCAAENIGLQTRRSFPVPFADDLDGLDCGLVPLFDCDFNLVEDAFDIAAGILADGNANGFPDLCEALVSYCTAGTTSSGCNATMGYTGGLPSLTNANPFTLTCFNVEGNKNGIFFYSISGRKTAPWGNSTSLLCLKSPTQRMNPPKGSGGTAGTCTGSFADDWNAYVATHPLKAINIAMTVGATVGAQAWFRDPAAGTGPVGAKGTALSDALEFQVGP